MQTIGLISGKQDYTEVNKKALVSYWYKGFYGVLWYSVLLRDGRDGRIWTYDPLHPMQVRYQAALRPDLLNPAFSKLGFDGMCHWDLKRNLSGLAGAKSTLARIENKQAL